MLRFALVFACLSESSINDEAFSNATVGINEKAKRNQKEVVNDNGKY